MSSPPRHSSRSPHARSPRPNAYAYTDSQLARLIQANQSLFINLGGEVDNNHHHQRTKSENGKQVNAEASTTAADERLENLKTLFRHKINLILSRENASDLFMSLDEVVADFFESHESQLRAAVAEPVAEQATATAGQVAVNPVVGDLEVERSALVNVWECIIRCFK